MACYQPFTLKRLFFKNFLEMAIICEIPQLLAEQTIKSDLTKGRLRINDGYFGHRCRI